MNTFPKSRHIRGVKTLEYENYGKKETLDQTGMLEERQSLKKPKYIISKHQIKLPTIANKKVGSFQRIKTVHGLNGTGAITIHKHTTRLDGTSKVGI